MPMNFPATQRSLNEKIAITSLDIYPLRFASKEIIQALRHRGQMFWLCRKQCLVSYNEKDGEISDNRVSMPSTLVF